MLNRLRRTLPLRSVRIIANKSDDKNGHWKYLLGVGAAGLLGTTTTAFADDKKEEFENPLKKFAREEFTIPGMIADREAAK